jgi:hypothetical protein
MALYFDERIAQMAKNPTEIEKELLNMPEYFIWEEINALDNSFNVFHGNYLELKKAFKLFSKKRKEKMENRLKKLVRLLHNFTASAISFLDHSTVYYERLYEPKGLFGEYRTEYNNRFRNDPLSCFIRDLRNYCVHITAPEIEAEFEYTGEFPETSCVRRKIYVTKKFLFKKSDLFNRGDWSELSKQYINSAHGTTIELEDHINEYFMKTEAFYSWIKSKEKQIYSKEIDLVQKKQNEFEKALSAFWSS